MEYDEIQKWTISVLSILTQMSGFFHCDAPPHFYTTEQKILNSAVTGVYKALGLWQMWAHFFS